MVVAWGLQTPAQYTPGLVKTIFFFSDDLHLPTDDEVPLNIHLGLRSKPCAMESLF